MAEHQNIGWSGNGNGAAADNKARSHEECGVDPEQLSDDSLIAQIVESKNEAAGHEWVRRHRPWIVARVRDRAERPGLSPRDIPDAVQQSLLVLWEALPAYHRARVSGQHAGRFRAYAETVVGNRLCNFVRGQWRGERFRRSPELEALLLTQENGHSGQRALTWDNVGAKRDEPETQAQRSEFWEVLERFRAQLAMERRQTWDLMVQGRPLAEICAALDASGQPDSESTAKRLKKELREQFERYAQLDSPGRNDCQVNRLAPAIAIAGVEREPERLDGVAAALAPVAAATDCKAVLPDAPGSPARDLTTYLLEALGRTTVTIDAPSHATTMVNDASNYCPPAIDAASSSLGGFLYGAVNRTTVTIDGPGCCTTITN